MCPPLVQCTICGWKGGHAPLKGLRSMREIQKHVEMLAS